MTAKEAAARLEVGLSTVYLLCERGQLSHARIGAGRGTIRISEDDLRAFLESCRAGKPAPARFELKHIKVR
jgi:excisionase family DNA binding protein